MRTHKNILVCSPWVGLIVTTLLFAELLLFACFASPAAAEGLAGTQEAILTEDAQLETAEPFTWQYLATIPGAAAFTLLVVEFLKAPLDKIWRIPTRIFAYFIALLAMLAGTVFKTGSALTLDAAFLAAVNAILATCTAMGAYELTFAKLEQLAETPRS